MCFILNQFESNSSTQSSQDSNSQSENTSEDNFKNPDFRICSNCLTYKKLLPLGCGHKFCSDCIRKKLSAQSFSVKFQEIFCWLCYKSLNFFMIFEFLDRDKILNLSISEKFQKTGEETKTCEICYRTFHKDFFLSLECKTEHPFCVICIYKLIEDKIITKQVTENDLTCPECNKKISYELIRKIMPKHLFIKFDNFLADLYKSKMNDCRISRCKNCEVLVECGLQIEIFICTLCKKKFCQYCYELHHEGACNFRYARNLINHKDKQCPKCFSQVVKDDGCNYVICPWPGCDTRFCYICLKPLTPKEHNSHFPNGSYQDFCLSQEFLNTMTEESNN